MQLTSTSRASRLPPPRDVCLKFSKIFPQLLTYAARPAHIIILIM